MNVSDEKIIQLPGTQRLRIVRAQLPASKLGALSSLFPPAIPIEHDRRAELARTAEAVTLLLDDLNALCRSAGLLAEAAAYRVLADDADTLAKRIEAPILEGVE